MKQKEKIKPTFMRRVMKTVCGVLAVMLAVMVGVTAYFQNLINRGQLAPEDALPTLSQMLSTTFSGQSQDYGGHDPIGGSGSGLTNILLIGRDQEEGSGGRSDSMILCTLDRKQGKLTMTSFLRDMYLPIPGYGSNRLNAAYSFGGRDLLDSTLSQNFGIHIDANMEVDFETFARIIDMLGGVSIELRADEAAAIQEKTGIPTEEGMQLLTGWQALTYSRIRKLDADGDFSRTGRQRRVLSALLDSLRSSDLKTLLSITNQVLPMVDTDLSLIQITRLAVEWFPLLSGMEQQSQTIPQSGAYEDRSIDGMSVLVPNMEAARLQLRQSLLGE